MEMYFSPHPGQKLQDEVLQPLKLSITKAAEHLGISRKTLSAICNGRASITAETACRLEIVFSTPSADTWLRLQNAYDLFHLRQENLSAIPLPESAKKSWTSFRSVDVGDEDFLSERPAIVDENSNAVL